MITVNGEKKNYPTGISVADLLKQEGLQSQRVAVEKNGEIVRRTEFETTELKEGDRIEIVHFVGGG